MTRESMTTYQGMNPFQEVFCKSFVTLPVVYLRPSQTFEQRAWTKVGWKHNIKKNIFNPNLWDRMLKCHRLMCRDHNLQENMLQALNTWWFMLGTQLLLFFTLSLRIFAQYVWSISGRVQNQASEVHMHDLKRNEFWRPCENIHRFCCSTWQRGTWCPGPVVGGVPGRTGNHFQQITHLWIVLMDMTVN